MKIKELISLLLEFDENQEVMILDSFNGCGNPRTINFGPSNRKIRKLDAKDCGDCEEKVGEKIVVIGYGCY